MWSDTAFLYTAYNDAAASIFGGKTIVKASFISKPQVKSLTEIEKKEKQDMRIIIIDEILFVNYGKLERLDRRFKEIKHSASLI